MMLFTNNCQNVYEKRLNFQMLPETTNFNKTWCNDSSILVLFKRVILKWVGVPDFWEGQVKKWSFPHGLSREFFQAVPDRSEHSIFHLF